MERCMKQYEKDYMEMKTIMLKQEGTFRHQVGFLSLWLSPTMKKVSVDSEFYSHA